MADREILIASGTPWNYRVAGECRLRPRSRFTQAMGFAIRDPCGGMLFVVAVHARHRGRLFLPFADDDQKTAEVMSKVPFLARDTEIKDPSVLEQIRSRVSG